jgi:ataxin-10
LISCGLVNSFIDQSLQSQLFASLSSPNEPISPSQTTLLKLLDSRLSDSTAHIRPSSSVPNNMDNMEVDDPTHPNRFLIPVFHLLSAYAMTSMSHVPDDARLPKVFEGLVLVCEALSSIGLKVQGEKDLQVGDIGRGAEEGSDGDLIQEMKDPEDGTGLIKPIIGISAFSLIEICGAYIPRIYTLA